MNSIVGIIMRALISASVLVVSLICVVGITLCSPFLLIIGICMDVLDLNEDNTGDRRGI